MKTQLLDLFNKDESFSNFVTICNQNISDALQNLSNQFTHITGSKHSGKTHLIKSWIKLALSKNKSAIYLNADNAITKNEIRQLATYYQFIGIDNIDNLNEQKQIELFDLFNAIKLNNRDNFLLTSSTFTLDNDQIREDLRTRILSGLNLFLKSPDDDELMQTLKICTEKEGILINEAELKYLVNHYTRNIGILINIIHEIANIATTEKRNITIPLIKSVIEKNT